MGVGISDPMQASHRAREGAEGDAVFLCPGGCRVASANVATLMILQVFPEASISIHPKKNTPSPLRALRVLRGDMPRAGVPTAVLAVT